MICITFSVQLFVYRLAFIGLFAGAFWPVLFIHILAAGLTLTPGIGGFLFALVLGACFFPQVVIDQKRRVIVISAGILAVIGSIVLSAKAPWDIRSAFYSIEGAVNYMDVGPRQLTWIGAFSTMLDNPVLGAGLGNARQCYFYGGGYKAYIDRRT